MRLPPGPRPDGPQGVLSRLRADWLGSLCALQQEYGDVVWLPMPARLPPMVLLGHPKHVEQVLVRDAAGFRKSALQRRVRIAIGNGVFTSEGAAWRRQRRLLMPHFQPARVATYAAEMQRQGERLRAVLAQGGEHDVFALALDLALRVVVRVLFAQELEQVTNEVGLAFTDMADSLHAWLYGDELSAGFAVTPNLRRLQVAVAALDRLILRLIAERRARGAAAGDGDLLSLLIHAQDEDGGEGALTDRELRDQALTLFVAGSETVALTLAWGLYLLACNPAAAARARALTGEAREGFIDQVVREVLRLYPPTWAFSHAPCADWTLVGYDIPCDTTVLMSPYLLHRDERFFADPGSFRPERWAGAPPPRYAYLPFGEGPRACLGARFALQELRLVLGALLSGVELTPIEGRAPQVLPRFTLRPESGVWLRSRAVTP